MAGQDVLEVTAVTDRGGRGEQARCRDGIGGRRAGTPQGAAEAVDVFTGRAGREVARQVAGEGP